MPRAVLADDVGDNFDDLRRDIFRRVDEVRRSLFRFEPFVGVETLRSRFLGANRSDEGVRFRELAFLFGEGRLDGFSHLISFAVNYILVAFTLGKR